MNQAYWHLVLNHLPIIIPMIGLLIMVSGYVFSSEILKRAAYSLFILGALFAIAAMSTGEGAEEIVESLQGIDEKLIKIHEESAEIFSNLLYILGGLSVIGFWASLNSKSFSKGFSIAIVVYAFIILFYAKQTGTTGGKIRHTEIRAYGTNISNPTNYNNLIDNEVERENE